MTTATRIDPAETAPRLRTWAAGSHPLAAAVELLICAFDGRFARADRAWIRIEPNGYVWLDADVLHAGLGPLSGGERRVLEVVCALADDRPIHLADTLAGLDRNHLDLVLAACAHAAGSHEHAELAADPDTDTGRIRVLGSAHPWPRTAQLPAATPDAFHLSEPASRHMRGR